MHEMKEKPKVGGVLESKIISRNHPMTSILQ